MSKYSAYPFLYDASNDLRCDYEIFTDEISSTIGLLISFINDKDLGDELNKINELVYHMNACLRTKVTVTEEEINWLESRMISHQDEVKDRVNKFVTPQGSTPACFAHVIRTKFKALVRLLHRHREQGHSVDGILFDFANLFSGYFFVLALKLNKDFDVEEIEFISRNYK
ncbi:MAG: ATP:cob(I)alamin adenosyltransferase [Romboutsia sp.]